MPQTKPILPKDDVPQALWPLMERMSAVAADLSRLIARGGIDQDLAGDEGVNSDGDGQKTLDVIADNLFMSGLRTAGVRHYASEEQDEVVTLDPEGAFAVAIDPLDGSSNIAVNIPVGTIISVFPAADNGNASFLRAGTEQIAAGYFIYGPQTCLVVSFGAGVLRYTLDTDTRSFVLTARDLQISVQTSEYAINASNYHHWSTPIRAFVDDMVQGATGPRGRAFNMRWVASLVAEAHRILARGGVFLYPSDRRKGYENGRLRIVYEGAPIAFLAVQAGGAATDGLDPILTQIPTSLHQRTPLVFGCKEKVARVSAYHDLGYTEESALFSKRGLFRS